MTDRPPVLSEFLRVLESTLKDFKTVDEREKQTLLWRKNHLDKQSHTFQKGMEDQFMKLLCKGGLVSCL